jgi:hypothetical protein
MCLALQQTYVLRLSFFQLLYEMYYRYFAHEEMKTVEIEV